MENPCKKEIEDFIISEGWNNQQLFDYFDNLEKDKQANLLKQCFDNMNTAQRRNVFSELESECITYNQINGKEILKRISKFN